jgi:hypothetical protein
MKRNLLIACSLILVCAAWVSPASADPGRGTTVLCYLWASIPSPTIGAPYEPNILYSYNEQNRAKGISVTKTATGSYTVTCTGVGGGTAWGEGGHVQVTAVGSNSTFCKVVDWSTGAANFRALVHFMALISSQRTAHSTCCSSGSIRSAVTCSPVFHKRASRRGT